MNSCLINQVLNRHPLIVNPSTPLIDTIALMNQPQSTSCQLNESESELTGLIPTHARCALVMEGKQLLGIFTERDLLGLTAERKRLAEMAVGDAMTQPVITFPSTEVRDLWVIWCWTCQQGISHLPIVDQHNQLIGLIDQKSLLQALALPEEQEVIELLPRQVSQWKRAPTEFLHSHSGAWSEQVKQRTVELEEANQQLQQEIIKRRLIEQQLVQDALYDRLTGLANRTLLLDRIELTIQQAKRNPHYLFAVLFIDLDHFKQINDSLGHVMGDRLLIAVAQLLQQSLRENDLVARLGGDEFIILLDGIHQLQDATQISERIQELLSAPFELEGQAIFTSASIGIVLGSTDYDHSEDLLRDADLAMYRAKAKGKAGYEVFDGSMYLDNLKAVELEKNLRLALERGELVLQYQPIVALSNSELVGLEALIRWQSPHRGWLFPGEFMPMAEDTGLSVPIGEWVLAEACRQLKIWQAKFASLPHIAGLTISINLSSQQLQQPHQFIQTIDEVLQATGLNGSCLQLEIPESLLVTSDDTIQNIWAQIKQRQIQLSIDDFGTGYSCLRDLTRLPLDTLKIERSLIEGLNYELEKWEVVRTIIALAKTLGLNTIAEGIETTEQWTQLKNFGCQFGQGYLLTEPLDAQEIESLLGLRGIYP